MTYRVLPSQILLTFQSRAVLLGYVSGLDYKENIEPTLIALVNTCHHRSTPRLVCIIMSSEVTFRNRWMSALGGKATATPIVVISSNSKTTSLYKLIGLLPLFLFTSGVELPS